jgi:hypothetical protein
LICERVGGDGLTTGGVHGIDPQPGASPSDWAHAPTQWLNASKCASAGVDSTDACKIAIAADTREFLRIKPT